MYTFTIWNRFQDKNQKVGGEDCALLSVGLSAGHADPSVSSPVGRSENMSSGTCGWGKKQARDHARRNTNKIKMVDVLVTLKTTAREKCAKL